MPGTPTRLGPFVNGLNNVSKSGESKDDEVTSLVNLEVSLDTTLTSRPPMESVNGTAITQPVGWEVLGVYRLTSATWYLIVEKPTGATTWDILAYPQGDLAGSPTTIKSVSGVANKVVTYVQYNDYGYFNVAEGATDTGFRWKFGSAFSAIAAMPRGTAMVTWKDRIWVTGSGTGTTGNYLWFSTVDATGPHPETWNTSTDFINVEPGLGGLNTALLPLSNSLLIFKEDATHRFAFTRAPKDGERTLVSPSIGASGANSVAGFENYAFVYDRGRVYELINNSYRQINLVALFEPTVDAVDGSAPGVDMSVVNRRILIRYQNTVYSYHVDTRTWAQWQTYTGTPGKFVELPGDSSLATAPEFMAASRGLTQQASSNLIPDATFTDVEIKAARTAGALTRNATLTFSGGTATFTLGSDATAQLNLNKTGNYAGLTGANPNDFETPASNGQTFTFSATMTTTAATPPSVYVTMLKKDGSSTSQLISIASGDLPNVSKNITLAADCIAFYVAIGWFTGPGAGSVFTLANPSFTRAVVDSTKNLIKLTEEYANTPAKEFMSCYFETKSYDYQANSVFKRLFLWGVDIKTPRKVLLKAMPLGEKRSTTWDDLEPYTWDQLEQGTWDSPLSWLDLSATVSDEVDAVANVSENGRFFIKAKGSLRFRQIQFRVEASTFGNSDTGPVKIFSLTTFTRAGQLVVDKAT